MRPKPPSLRDTAAIEPALARADAAHAAGRLVEAVEGYGEVLRLAPEHPVALHRLGLIAQRSSNREAALGLFDRALAARPGFAAALQDRVLLLLRLGRLDEAVDGFRALAAVRRRGKWIILDLDEDLHLCIHLGMTGQLLVCPPDAELAKHTHAIAKLASGRELRFVDPRRFGRLSVVRSQNGFETAGVEPLDVSFDAFVPLFRKRKLPMKSALLNQKLLRGVGNIYADESLFRAGIRPRRRAATLSREKLCLLYKSVQQVLQEAIAAGGSSISDYVGAEGEPGFFQMQHRVYGREGEPCLNCGTAIKRIVIAGRSSHYCPHCQK